MDSLASALCVWWVPLSGIAWRPAPSAVAGAVAFIRPLWSTRISECVITRSGCWTRSWARGRTRSRASSFDFDIAEVEVSARACLCRAAITPEPAVVGWPVANCERHTVSQIICHICVVATSTSHLNWFSILWHRNNEWAEIASTFVEINFEVEWLLSVYFVLTSGTVIVISDLVLCVLNAGTTTIALTVETFAIGRIAWVNGGLGNKHICLHDVVLWTVVASNLVGIAIIITICIPVITISVFSRCTH